jgi:hypothetical protein
MTMQHGGQCAIVGQQRQQKVLATHVFVLESRRLLFSGIQQFGQFWGKGTLRNRAIGLWQAFHQCEGFIFQHGMRNPEPIE